MDLALEDRIDTDAERLVLVNSTPVGDDLLDPFLKQLSNQASETRDTTYWVNRFAGAQHATRVQQGALDGLVARGIVEVESGGLLSVARSVVRGRRYPHLDGEAGREVESRIMTILFSEEIPTPRDVMLIALVHACRIFGRLLAPGEMTEIRDRLELICTMDLIARTVFQAIREVGIVGPESAPGEHPTIGSKKAREKALANIPLADGGGLPIVGNALRMLGDPTLFFARQYRTLGPVFRVRAFSRNFTVLAGPEANMFIQRHGRLHFRTADFYANLAPSLGAHRVALGMDGAEHFRLRKVLARGYSRRFYLDRMDDALEIMEREIEAVNGRGPMPALPILQRLFSKQIGSLCTGFEADEYFPDILAYIDRVVAITSLRRPAFSIRTPRMRRLWGRMEELCEHILALHEGDRPDAEPDLIDDILALHRADPLFLPQMELASACLGPFIAGLHAGSSIATCMLYSLLKHPDVMAKVTREAGELFANGGPTATKMQAMGVTHRVVMETLRIHRVAPVLVRTTVNTFEFGGHVIPAGTMVMFASTVPHVLPEHFPEPERFDIDRYGPERAEHQASGVYAPFGLGTHRCLGNGFSEVSLLLTLAFMLHRARITMHPPNYKLKKSYSTVATPRPSFKIAIAPLSSGR